MGKQGRKGVNREEEEERGRKGRGKEKRRGNGGKRRLIRRNFLKLFETNILMAGNKSCYNSGGYLFLLPFASPSRSKENWKSGFCFFSPYPPPPSSSSLSILSPHLLRLFLLLGVIYRLFLSSYLPRLMSFPSFSFGSDSIFLFYLFIFDSEHR